MGCQAHIRYYVCDYQIPDKKKSTWGRRIFFWFIVGCCKICRGREGMVVDDSMIVGVFNDAPPPDLLE